MERDSSVLAQIYTRICAEPDVDAHREAYRDALPIEDPHRRFIELQLLRAKKRRETMSFINAPYLEELDFLKSTRAGYPPNCSRWYYCITPHALKDRIGFDRGFVHHIECTAKHFVEARKQIFADVPLQGVTLINNTDSPLSLSEILCCSELTRLESLCLMGRRLSASDTKAITECENIRTLRYLDLVYAIQDPTIFEALAESSITRGIYMIDFSFGKGTTPYPGRRIEAHPTEIDSSECPLLYPRPMPPAGQELEHRFGYIPWLHIGECHHYDIAYHVKMGTLPRRRVGSPVDYENDPEDGKPKQI